MNASGMRTTPQPPAVAGLRRAPWGERTDTLIRTARAKAVPLSRSSRRQLLWGLVVLVGLAVYLFETAGDTIPRESQVLALAFFLLTTVPAWVYVHQAMRGRESPVPFLPLIGILYGTYFGLPVFSPDIHWRVPSSVLPSVLNETLRGIIAGWLALLLGFYAAGPLVRALVPPLRYALRERRARSFAWLCTGAGAAATFAMALFRIPTVVRSAVDFISSLWVVGIVLLLLLQFRGQVSRREAQLTNVAVVPAYLLMLLGTGLTTGFGMAVILLGLVYWTQKRRVPAVPLFVGLLATIMIRGGGTDEFRREVWFGRTQLGPLERGMYHIDLAYRSWTSAPARTLHKSVVGVSNRVGYLNTFTYVVYATPELVPYWRGGSYYALASSFIPRVLWPGKPTKELGQQFGHRYGLLDPWDRWTSYNLPYVIEFFVNFGWLGVVLGMLGIGLLYRALYCLLNPVRAPGGVLLIGLVMLFSLTGIESDLSLLFGSVVTRLVLYVVVLSPVLRKLPAGGAWARTSSGVQAG